MTQKHVHIATEQRSLTDIVARLPMQRHWAQAVLSRLGRITTIPAQARVLEVGAAAGGLLAALSQLGYQCEGIEPWEEARLNAGKLSEYLGIPIHIVVGTAEAIPYDPDTFDVIFAFAVIEHVLNVEKAFAEIYRVLKPRGVFWFSAASAMSPWQNEIRGFPLFGWYPDTLKRKIMYWAKDTKPHLIGHTQMPAINWFTPRKACLLLHKHGFTHVYDRWDLRGDDEGRSPYRLPLRLIRTTKLLKLLADIAIPGCSYAAIK